MSEIIKKTVEELGAILGRESDEYEHIQDTHGEEHRWYWTMRLIVKHGESGDYFEIFHNVDKGEDGGIKPFEWLELQMTKVYPVKIETIKYVYLPMEVK